MRWPPFPARPKSASILHLHRVAAEVPIIIEIMMRRLAILVHLAVLARDGGHAFTFPVQNARVASAPSSALSVATNHNRWETEIDSAIDYASMTSLPRHPSNVEANEILDETETALRSMQEKVLFHNVHMEEGDDAAAADAEFAEEEVPLDMEQESVYANSYVDLGKVDTVGFDYDYTLVTYKKELLSLIYDMALTRLVEEKEYPREMLTSGLKFDPFFSIRGE